MQVSAQPTAVDGIYEAIATLRGTLAVYWDCRCVDQVRLSLSMSIMLFTTIKPASKTGH